MLKKKIIKILILAGFVVGIIGLLPSTPIRNMHGSFINQETQTTKIDENVIVEELKDNLSINILSVCASSRGIIDKSPLSFNAFKRQMIVTFYGQADYIIDINCIDKDHVVVDGNNIQIYMKEPMVEAKINSYAYEKNYGWTQSNAEFKASPEEVLQLELQAKQKILEEGMKEENMQEARNRVEDKVKFLLRTITHENYNIKITFIK